MATVKSGKPHALDLSHAISALQTFSGPFLTQTLGEIELSLRGLTTQDCAGALASCGAKAEVIGAAGLVKRLAGQINVIVHALGILLCLPHILQPGEVIDYVSLGAGNTGRPFDLETNRRIAEFKFIRWQGGAEAIRQNSLFKDFYLMAEHRTEKQKFLFVLGTEHPLKFLNGGRALSSILSHGVKLQKDFLAKYGEQYRTVRDYYLPRKEMVLIQDVCPFLPDLLDALAEEG
jgi:hypothetical protein